MTTAESYQPLLAGEHAAVYGYQVLAAQASGGLRARLVTDLNAHRAARDTLAAVIAAQGQTPIAAEPAYAMPSRGEGAASNSPAETAALIESRLGLLYAQAIAEPDGDVRRTGLSGLRATTVRSSTWSGTVPVLPGLELASPNSRARPTSQPGLARPNHRAQVSSTSATATSALSPLRRSRTSMMPSAKLLPITTMVGMPSSSASLNFTPGDTFGRSSNKTSTPSADNAAANLSASVNALRPCPLQRCEPEPAQGQRANTTRARRRSARPRPPLRATHRCRRNPSSRRAACRSRRAPSVRSASAYLVPSWKMWPISMPRAALNAPLPSGDGSPSHTSAASMVPSGVKSRPRDQVEHVLTGLVRAGDPPRTLDRPAGRRGTGSSSRCWRPTPAGRCSRLHQLREGIEVAFFEHPRFGREHCRFERFRSTSRSPGNPTTSGLVVPPSAATSSTTFFNVSAAVHARPSARGCCSLARSTSVWIVGVPGVSSTCAAGWPSIAIAAGLGVTTASTLAA